ncbi:MAG: hypothetical protein WBA57_14080 [Elainellaceae cyanobacterium]
MKRSITTARVGYGIVASGVGLAIVAGLLQLSTLAGQSQDSPTGQPDIIQLPESATQPGSSDAPRLFKMAVTLTNPDDLKVRQGDAIAKGQLLADRVEERQSLEGRLGRLEISLKRLQESIRAPLPPTEAPEVAALPQPTFLEQVAGIDRALVAVDQAETVVNLQQRKVDALQLMPQGQAPPEVLQHELARLEQLQQAQAEAIANLALAEAQLERARQERQHQEYLHSLEMSKRKIAIEDQQLRYQEQMQAYQQQVTDRQYRLAEVEAQIEQTQAQLRLLEAVRSPYNGTVQRIEWKGQTNEAIQVELTLRVDGESQSPQLRHSDDDGGANQRSIREGGVFGERNAND